MLYDGAVIGQVLIHSHIVAWLPFWIFLGSDSGLLVLSIKDVLHRRLFLSSHKYANAFLLPCLIIAAFNLQYTLMPAPLHSRPQASFTAGHEASCEDHGPRVQVSHEDEDAIADIHRTLTEKSHSGPVQYPEPHSSFDKFLEEQVQGGKKRSNLGVSFQSVSTWGDGDGHANVKTLGTALWRTLTFQDIYEWTIQPWASAKKPEDGRQLIRDFSGVVESGEMMLYVVNESLIYPEDFQY